MIKTMPVYNPLDLVNWDSTMDSIAKSFSFYQILNNVAAKYGEYSNQFKNILGDFVALCSNYSTSDPIFIKSMRKYQKAWL